MNNLLRPITVSYSTNEACFEESKGVFKVEEVWWIYIFTWAVFKYSWLG